MGSLAVTMYAKSVAALAAFVASASAFRGNAVATAPAGPRGRSIGPMMASVKELRDRVGSVKNTKKITSAMKLVAAAKVRRAQDAVLKTRPFSETLQKVLGG